MSVMGFSSHGMRLLSVIGRQRATLRRRLPVVDQMGLRGLVSGLASMRRCKTFHGSSTVAAWR